MERSRLSLKAEPGDFLTEERPHECNFYCRRDLHAHILYTDGDTLPEGTVAIVAGGKRNDIVDMRPAPEVPPIDPTDPLRRPWAHRFVVWSRVRE